MIIGITGMIASGKSIGAQIIADTYGFEIINVDAYGHDALLSQKKALIATFSEEILNEMGAIDRKKLGAMVFKDSSLLQKLNNLVHPVMVQMVKDALQSNVHYIIDAALLFQMGLAHLCDVVIVVRTSTLRTIIRGKRRDGRSMKQVLAILKEQNLKKHVKQNANNVDIHHIYNNGNVNNYRKQLIKTMSHIGVTNERFSRPARFK